MDSFLFLNLCVYVCFLFCFFTCAKHTFKIKRIIFGISPLHYCSSFIPHSGWELFPEQFTQLERPKLSSKLRPHSTQLLTWTCTKAPAPVPLPSAQVSWQHSPLPSGPYTFSHPSEQLSSALSFTTLQPHSWPVCHGSVIPCEAPLLSSSGEADIQTQECRASTFSAPQEGAVS